MMFFDLQDSDDDNFIHDILHPHQLHEMLEEFQDGMYEDFFDMDDDLSYEDEFPYFYDNYSDDDDDSFIDTDNHNRIFVSLQDSKVLRRLYFHRALAPRRLPKLRIPTRESYEDLHRLLAEVEILLKTWTQRNGHALTAHISRAPQRHVEDTDGTPAPSGESQGTVDPLIGEPNLDVENDFTHHQRDFVYESDESSQDLQREPNEILTKKKYCQSKKLWLEIFESRELFDEFHALIQMIKNRVFEITFNLFFSSLPTGTAQLLPLEVWEKIWKLTQVPDKSSLHGLCSGTRTKGHCERERVADLFGAVGNLHMTIFEILFKNARITQLATLMEVDTMDVVQLDPSQKVPSYVKTLFQRLRCRLDIAFHKLNAFHLTMSGEADPELLESSSEQKSEPLEQIKRGWVTLTKETCRPAKDANDGFRGESLFGERCHQPEDLILTSSTSQDLIAFLDNRSEESALLTVLVWNVVSNRAVAKIDTKISVLDVCLNSNRNSPHLLFSLTGGQFSVLTRSCSPKSDIIQIFQWRFDANASETKLLDDRDKLPSITHEVCQNLSFEKSVRQTTVTSCSLHSVQLSGGLIKEPQLLVCHRNMYSKETSLLYFDAESGKLNSQATITFLNKHLTLECLKGNRAILRDPDQMEFVFFDLVKGKTLDVFKETDLCKDANHDHSPAGPSFPGACLYQAKMDQNPDRQEFAIFCQNLAAFQLFHYSTEEDDDDDLLPEVVASGNTRVYEFNFRTISNLSLYNGCLYGAPLSEIHLRAHTGDFCRDNDELRAVNLIAFDLRTQEQLPVMSWIGDPNMEFSQVQDVSEQALMNEYYRYMCMDYVPQRVPYFIKPSVMILVIRQGFVRLDFHSSTKDAIQAEEASYERIFDTSQMGEKYQHLMSMYRLLQFNSERRFDGTIVFWKNSYGFAKIDLDESLENVFVHLSQFTNREPGQHLNVKDKISFKISKSTRGFEAEQVLFLSTATKGPKGSKVKKQTHSTSERRNPNHRGRGSGRSRRRGARGVK